MKNTFRLALLLAATLRANAEPLTQSTFTDVIKDVNVVAADTKAAAPATVSAVVKAPNLVRTGAASRAELTAPDNSVTRIGANSVFAFDPTSRTVNLERGSVLFHSPKGKGGVTIKSGGASAAVLGSTLMCSTGADGTFKTIFLEGKDCVVTLANGKSVTLHPGQMVVVLPGQTDFGPVLDIDLAKLVDTSLLLKGFSHDLDSLPLILAVIDDQKKTSPGGTNYISLLNKNSLDHNTQQT
ncbi:MAG: hypothetical protein RL380_146, partial [Verrucomicrobiota bacterium]